MDMYLARGGIEVLKLQLAYCSAIHGISKVASELLHIEMVCALPDFLIGGEADAYLTMLDFGVLYQVFAGRDYLGNTGFVICAEQRLAVRDNDVLSRIAQYFRVFGCL